MKRSLLAAFLLLVSQVSWSEDADEYCAGLKGHESKALEDINQFVKYMNRNKATCDDLFEKFEASYFELSTQVYRQYREYLNQFLTTYSQEFDMVKNFQKMAMSLREGQMDALIKAHAEKKTPDTERALYSLLSSKAKLIKSPAVYQNCEVKGKRPIAQAQQQKLNEALITKEAKLNNQNLCAAVVKNSGYPMDQKTFRFQLEGGRAMVWFCYQKFQADGATLIDSKARCLAYDLQENKMILGDQRQSHLFGSEKPFNIDDGRMVLAKSHGYVPLTYIEFIKKNKAALPSESKFFYQKVPKECNDQSRIETAVAKASSALMEMEKNSGFIEF